MVEAINELRFHRASKIGKMRSIYDLSNSEKREFNIQEKSKYEELSEDIKTMDRELFVLEMLKVLFEKFSCGSKVDFEMMDQVDLEKPYRDLEELDRKSKGQIEINLDSQVVQEKPDECPACHGSIDDDTNYCTGCGQQINYRVVRCKCGYLNSSMSNHCKRCGVVLDPVVAWMIERREENESMR